MSVWQLILSIIGVGEDVNLDSPFCSSGKALTSSQKPICSSQTTSSVTLTVEILVWENLSRSTDEFCIRNIEAIEGAMKLIIIKILNNLHLWPRNFIFTSSNLDYTKQTYRIQSRLWKQLETRFDLTLGYFWANFK